MAKCPICETIVNDNQFLEKYISPFNNQEYKLYHCPNCDLQWWEPLKMVPEFYEKEVFESYKVFHLGLRNDIDENHKLFFKFLLRKIKNRKVKILDIGCGDGIFLKALYNKSKNFEIWGIDYDSKSIETARKNNPTAKLFTMSFNEFVKYATEKKFKI